MPNVKRSPCSACPFRRDSLPGYLGEASGDPSGFLTPIWSGAVRQPCHKKVDWERPGAQAQAATAPLCQGALVMMRNACKLPLDPEIRDAVAETDGDRASVFCFPLQFVEHHSGVKS